MAIVQTPTMRKKGDRNVYPKVTHTILYGWDVMISQYNDAECPLATCVLHDSAKFGCNHHDTRNGFQIRLKALLHAIPAFSFVVKHAIETIPDSDVVSEIAKAMVTELIVYAVEYIWMHVNAIIMILETDSRFV